MAASYSERDLDLIPYLTFSLIKEYIKSKRHVKSKKKTSSAENHISIGYMYFRGGYIHDLRGKLICFAFTVYHFVLSPQLLFNCLLLPFFYDPT